MIWWPKRGGLEKDAVPGLPHRRIGGLWHESHFIRLSDCRFAERSFVESVSDAVTRGDPEPGRRPPVQPRLISGERNGTPRRTHRDPLARPGRDASVLRRSLRLEGCLGRSFSGLHVHRHGRRGRPLCRDQPPAGRGGRGAVLRGRRDVDAALARAQELGGTIVQPKQSVPGTSFGVLADVHGHKVGVASNG